MVPSSEKMVYFFEEGREDMKDLLGGKGAGLAEMTSLGLPVPPGFVVTTSACNAFTRQGGELPRGLDYQIDEALARLQKDTGRVLGDPENPLLVSVRSGAVESMPGMMDTVLNLGLNDDSVEGLARATGDRRFALDCYRRLIQMFADVVMRVDHAIFERQLDRIRRSAQKASDQALGEREVQRAVESFLEIYRQETGEDFPQDPADQLYRSISAVFRSWNNRRAIVYRRHHGIPDDLGTAATVQLMVFGNMGDDSGTGVVFSRNPATGEPGLYGEYLPNAQGEDVVAGIRTPRPIQQMAEEMPKAYQELLEAARTLETHYRDMQDVEFTVERGRLWILQTRAGKRTAAAAVRVAHDLVQESLIEEYEALLRLDVSAMTGLLHRNVDPSFQGDSAAAGLPASPGAAWGRCVFTADEAEARGSQGENVILVRSETTPDDIHGMVAAQGILTSRGGMTCHAAIVARGWGKPCVVGCDVLEIGGDGRRAWIADQEIADGDVVSIDGTTGRVYMGQVPVVDPEMQDEFKEILAWADRYRHLGVRANADTPKDATRAVELGAEGIGLCRTEHMFMGSDRLPVVQEMILAQTAEERKSALERLLPMQEEDFFDIFEAMGQLPVTIRLLDPPLHEFLPDPEELIEEIVRLEAGGGDEDLRASREILLRKVRAMREFNPMLGHRGCRVGIVHPEIYEMQVEAIFSAAMRVADKGLPPQVEVMIPLVSEARELEQLKKRVDAVARRVIGRREIDYRVGTMIEVPRACLTAGDVAQSAEFFSFGTNDLTQTVFGFSRDDAEAKFLHRYLQDRILDDNPFEVLDDAGVGALMRMATRDGRQARPDLKVGICGEHGGESRSIELCHLMGLDYVSCSPFRVPLARLAAAQAALRNMV